MPEYPGAVAIAVENLSIAYGDRKVLNEASLTIHEGERCGLVGLNGCGKSTFMKILACAEEADSGRITRKKGLRTAYLPQEFTLNDSITVRENIRLGASQAFLAMTEYETLPHDSDRAHILENEIRSLDGWNLENRIDTVMTMLRCPPGDAIAGTLSGGEKRRTALAEAIIASPDLLLLDEPTNHLDADSIEWLEKYILSYRGACLFVTHDRYFLDRVTTGIVELNAGNFHSYRGHYSDYLREKAEQIERDDTAEAKRQKFLKKELEWVRRGPKARTTKAQYRVNRYYEMASEEKTEKEPGLELIIPPPARLSKQAVVLNDIAVSLGNRILFDRLSLEITPGAKIGIIGANGTGKTTLLKTILGIIQPSAGTVDISPGVRFNYIDQERILLDDTKNILEEVGEGYEHVMLGEEKISVWSYLRRFLFPDDRIRTKVGSLSGGERARLILAKILKRGGNFIVLDEPTNDLDLSTLRLLEDALISFNGCVLLVSHDRYFLNRVCEGIFSFEKDGKLRYYHGNYDYCISKRAELAAYEEEKKTERPETSPREKAKPRKLKWKEQQELDAMEQSIMDAETEIEELQAHFLRPDFFKESPDRVKEIQTKLDEAQLRKERLYVRWEELEAIKVN